MNGTNTDTLNTLSALTITHTSETGTLLKRQRPRGDGVAEIVKRQIPLLPCPSQMRAGAARIHYKQG
jgi:hypothetical protein